VDEFARPLPLVAHDRWPRLEPVQPTQPLTTQQGVDGRPGKAGLPRQHVRLDPELAPSGAQLRDERGRVRPRLAVRGAAPVAEPGLTLAAEPADPLGAGLATDPGGFGRPRDRPARGDAVDQRSPAQRGQARSSMGHEGSLRRLRLPHQQPNDRGPHPVNNPIGN
jgi:hypothetical protein